MTGYTPVLAGAFDGKRPATPQATEQLDTQDACPKTDGEDVLQDMHSTMASFEVGPRNPTGDSGYGDSGLKSTISTTEHNNSGVQLAHAVHQPDHTHDVGYDSDEDKDDKSSLQTHLPSVSSTATSPPKSAVTPLQFTPGSVHQESPPPHPERPVSSTLKYSGRKTMTLGTRKLLDTGQCHRVSSPNGDPVQLDTSVCQIHPSTSVKHDQTDIQYGDPQDTDPVFGYPPNSMVVSGVNPTLLLSVNDATYIHGSFSMPVVRERDALYRTPSYNFFGGTAGD